MAQQKGILPLKGTIGNINFYKTKDGYFAREKTSITKERIANDPAFARTREKLRRAGHKCTRMGCSLCLQCTGPQIDTNEHRWLWATNCIKIKSSLFYAPCTATS